MKFSVIITSFEETHLSSTSLPSSLERKRRDPGNEVDLSDFRTLEQLVGRLETANRDCEFC